jgi:hypothetical protein
VLAFTLRLASEGEGFLQNEVTPRAVFMERDENVDLQELVNHSSETRVVSRDLAVIELVLADHPTLAKLRAKVSERGNRGRLIVTRRDGSIAREAGERLRRWGGPPTGPRLYRAREASCHRVDRWRRSRPPLPPTGQGPGFPCARSNRSRKARSRASWGRKVSFVRISIAGLGTGMDTPSTSRCSMSSATSA